MRRKLKQGNEGVWDYISSRAHILLGTDRLATERRVSLFCRGFQFFLNFIIYLSLGQILQLGDILVFNFSFFYIDWSYKKRERRKERKEEDG